MEEVAEDPLIDEIGTGWFSNYLAMLMGVAPREMGRLGGLNISLARLTLAGWILVLIMLATTVAVVVAIFWYFGYVKAKTDPSVRLPGTLIRIFSLPLVIFVAVFVFWFGKRIFHALGFPLFKEPPSAPSE